MKICPTLCHQWAKTWGDLRIQLHRLAVAYQK
jgi:hypothetical protein